MSVRVYLPATSGMLAELVAERRLPGPLRAHAVTAALREQWPDGDDEGWEYAALMAAAGDCAGLWAAADRPRRYVIAADVPEAAAVDADDPTLVEVGTDVVWKRVAAVHADTEDWPESGPDEDADLAWFATQEIEHLL